jgi:hypothetical protein
LVGVGVAVATALALGVGVPAGSINRPRRCDAVGDTDADESGVAVGMLRGVITDIGLGSGIIL